MELSLPDSIRASERSFLASTECLSREGTARVLGPTRTRRIQWAIEALRRPADNLLPRVADYLPLWASNPLETELNLFMARWTC